MPGGALTAADFRKAAEAGGFTGNIIVGTDLAGLRIPRSEVDQLRQALPEPAATTQAPATALYRKTETGEGRLSSTETIGVFIAIPITDPGGGQIMARDVTGGLERELIGLMANFVVGFEKR